MVSYFLSRQSAVATLLKRLHSLSAESDGVPARTRSQIAGLEHVLREVRLGRQDEFILPGDPPMRVVIVN
ncbi:hypothetical protein GIY62_32245 [Burkholderia plantarii]|uniref:hypothetical protein n=1 Tax=Burkholderia plantarii TaxID=41899 RepID=UPI00272BBC88|nr:hypothetical protein [Burkholderia plantarii]WLE62076.1 hypothetical protein GIY62_32245 [Burkholderia plantarii]